MNVPKERLEELIEIEEDWALLEVTLKDKPHTAMLHALRELLTLRSQNEALLSELIKRQGLGWSFCKEMRDTSDQLARTCEHALAEMMRAGMDEHLPTFEEMCGFMDKSDSEIEADNVVARERVRKSAAPEEV